MIRRLAIFAVLLAAALIPVAANATITPDGSYGTGGTASIPVQCAPGTMKQSAVEPGYGGRMYLAEQCAGGYYRLINVGDDGELASAWGTNGHLTIKLPAACYRYDSGNAQLLPAKDGSLYAIFSGHGRHGNNTALGDMHLCIAKITSAGKLVSTYGGNGPLRYLDRLCNLGSSCFSTGAAVDAHGRLVVFTQRYNIDWHDAAVFINRFATNGRPDVGFSQDGQRAFTYPNQGTADWGDVMGDDPVIGITVRGAEPGSAQIGTAFVRFDNRGELNSLFAGDGKLLVKNQDLGGAYIASIRLDTHNRIVYAAQKNTSWIDLRRLSGTGRSDTAFNAATTRIQAPVGKIIIPGSSFDITAGHYVVGWAASESEGPAYTTGFNDDGSRWTAVGPNGTAKGSSYGVAPDFTAFYKVKVAGDPPSSIDITRSLVQ